MGSCRQKEWLQDSNYNQMNGSVLHLLSTAASSIRMTLFCILGTLFFGSTCNQTQAYSARSFSDSRCPLSPTFLVCRLQKKCPKFLQRGLKESFKSTCVVNQCTLTFSDFTCFRIPYNYRLLRILSYLRYYWSYLVCRSYIMFIVQICNKLFISSF